MRILKSIILPTIRQLIRLSNRPAKARLNGTLTRIRAQRKEHQRRSWHLPRNKLPTILTLFQMEAVGRNQWTKRAVQTSKRKESGHLQRTIMANSSNNKTRLHWRQINRHFQIRMLFLHNKISSYLIWHLLASDKSSMMMASVLTLRSEWNKLTR